MPGTETLLLLMSLLTLSPLAAPAKLPATPCEFDGKTYAPGEMWFPAILPPGCTTCVCSQVGGRVRCESRQCPPTDCLHKAVLPGDCCPTCTGNVLPTLRSTTVAPPHAACYHDDVIRLHGERFASSTTGVIPRTGHQCTLCSCQDGRVLCRLKTCPAVNCTSPVQPPGDCCSTCPYDDDGKATAASSTDCHYQNRVYKHMETWHPTIGKLSCIICHCNKSRIECEKSLCVGQSDQPCGNSCCSPCSTKDSVLGDGRPCYFVYRQSSQRSYSVVFENMKTRVSEVLSWTLHTGYTTGYTRTLSEGVTWPRAEALGVVQTKQYKRFKKRISRQMKKCKSLCSRKFLQRHVRRLRKSLISTHDVTSC